MKIPHAVTDMLRRALWSAGQQFLAIAYVGLAGGITLGTLRSVPWYVAGGTALFAFAASLITSALTWKVPVLPFWEDWSARVGKTFLQSLAATMLGGVVLNAFDPSFRSALYVAAGVAAMAVVKGGLILDALAHLGFTSQTATTVHVDGAVPMDQHAGR